jgi:hypothetical protein
VLKAAVIKTFGYLI